MIAVPGGYVVGSTERQALIAWAEAQNPQITRMTRAEVYDKAISDLTTQDPESKQEDTADAAQAA